MRDLRIAMTRGITGDGIFGLRFPLHSQVRPKCGYPVIPRAVIFVTMLDVNDITEYYRGWIGVPNLHSVLFL